MSTTRIEVPDRAPRTLVAAGDHGVVPESPHWPLIVVTLLTQIALGAVATTLTLPAGSAKARISGRYFTKEGVTNIASVTASGFATVGAVTVLSAGVGA